MISASANSSREIVAEATTDGRAHIHLDGREFRVERHTDVSRPGAVGVCPIELIGVSLAA